MGRTDICRPSDETALPASAARLSTHRRRGSNITIAAPSARMIGQRSGWLTSSATSGARRRHPRMRKGPPSRIEAARCCGQSTVLVRTVDKTGVRHPLGQLLLRIITRHLQVSPSSVKPCPGSGPVNSQVRNLLASHPTLSSRLTCGNAASRSRFATGVHKVQLRRCRNAPQQCGRHRLRAADVGQREKQLPMPIPRRLSSTLSVAANG